MEKKNPSASSAKPIVQQIEQSVIQAGIPLQPKRMNLPPRNNPTQIVLDKMHFGSSKSDPNGSWTGVPENPYETPVQDADDL